MEHIIGKHNEGDKLRNAMGIAKQQWERYQAHIFRLSSSVVTKNEDECLRYKKIYISISNLIHSAEIYVKEYNEKAKKLKYKDDDSGNFEESAIKHAGSSQFLAEISSSTQMLREISNDWQAVPIISTVLSVGVAWSGKSIYQRYQEDKKSTLFK